jgi:hypothetical protein
MSREEFKRMKFSGQMEGRFNGELYPLAQVDFEEDLIGIIEPHSEDIQWKRCESITELFFKGTQIFPS